MQRITETRTCYVKGVRLHLEDYYELLDLLRSGDFELKITADKFQLENADEIEQLNQASIAELGIRSSASNRLYSSLHISVEGPGGKRIF